MKKLVSFIEKYWLFCIAVLGALVSLLLSLNKQYASAHWVLGIIAVLEILPLLWSMWQDIRTGKYGIDILAVTAIVASVILKQYWAAIVVVLMLTGGESLEDFAEGRSQSELNDLLKKAPATAHVIRKGKTLKVSVNEIRIGDKIIIKAGEVVPVDAEVIEGSANFNEASLTGESIPQLKEVGSTVLSGSINEDGAVTAKATTTAEDSQYQQIIKLVKNASSSRAPLVRLADRYSLPFTIIAYAIALAVWALSGHAIRFLEVIIVATPCPLILAAPIALISGMARASKYGIIVKTGQALERLAQSKAIAFDKTGTLTTGILSVKNITTFGKFSNDEVLKLAASVEQNSNHVLAQAVTSDARAKNIKLLKSKHTQEIAGFGLKANIKGQHILVGNYRLLEEEEVNVPDTFKQSSVDQTAAYVARNGHLIGIITFTDAIRPEAKETLRNLHKLGLKDIIMITGDNKVTASAVAKELSIDEVYADTLPADKLHILSSLRPKPVIFVGDGVNDAPVLTSSDVGIALGARGSTAASESADMVVMMDDLSRVAVGLEIARKTFSIARQSILIGIGLSLILMLAFATGKFSPLTGAIVQEVVDVVVIFNALRAHAINPLLMNK